MRRRKRRQIIIRRKKSFEKMLTPLYLQHDLEDAANRPTSDSANEEEKQGQSIAQSVYSENRRKAGQVSPSPPSPMELDGI
jgi:hypothetical protein